MTARTLITVGVATAGLAVLAPAAHATFPGANGPIAFQRITDPEEDVAHLFSVARPGARAVRLTRDGTGYNPDYSPDGTRIVFERRFGGARPDAIVTIGADGSSPAEVRTSCTADPCLGDNGPAWTPDGAGFVFERAFGPILRDNASVLDLVAAGADGSGEQLLRHFEPLGADGREGHDAQVSPDGTRIALTVLNISRKPRNGSAIHVLGTDGRFRRITPMRLNAGNADWSPDGRRIVFNSSYEGQDRVEVYTVRPDGSGLRRVRREPRAAFSFEPVWSPDGRRIAFARATTTSPPHIWTMRADGTRLRQLTNGSTPDVRPDWGARPVG